MKTRKEKIKLIQDYLNGEPFDDGLIRSYFLVKGEDVVEDEKTGKIYKKEEVINRPRILLLEINNHNEKEIFRNMGKQ